ncbi:FAD binding domain-containing protein [Chytridium lagenaria]|nr:FAD binding domain-containing protein [Chytridium lagenaria]
MSQHSDGPPSSSSSSPPTSSTEANEPFRSEISLDTSVLIVGADRSPFSKAISIHARTMELFEQISPTLADHLLRIGYTAAGFDFGLHSSGSLAGSDSLFLGDKAAGLAGLGRFGYTISAYIGLGGTIWRGVKLVESEQDNDGVTCVCEVMAEGNTVPLDKIFGRSAPSILVATEPRICVPPWLSAPNTSQSSENSSDPAHQPLFHLLPRRTKNDTAKPSSRYDRTSPQTPRLFSALHSSTDCFPPRPPTPVSPISPPLPFTPPTHLRIRSKYLCGADGTRSNVRTLHQIPYEGSPYPFTGMMADVRLSRDYFVAGLSQFSSPEGIAFVIPFRNGVHRVITMAWPTKEHPRPPSSIEALEKGGTPHAASWLPYTADGHPEFKLPDVTLDDLQETLNAILAKAPFPPPTLLHPLWVTGWGAERRLAKRFRKKRVFLVGDAAHAHGPIGGQGMNTGIQDAVNLSWKLAGALNATIPDRVLDTYEIERRFVSSRLNAICDGLLWGLLVKHPVARWMRERAVEWVVPILGTRAFFVGWLSGVGVSYRAVWKAAYPWLPPPSHLTRNRQRWTIFGVAGKAISGVARLAGSAIRSVATVTASTAISALHGLTDSDTLASIIPPYHIFLPTLTLSETSIQSGDRVPDAELTALDAFCNCSHTPCTCSTRTRLHSFFSSIQGFRVLLLLNHNKLAESSPFSYNLFTPDADLDRHLPNDNGDPRNAASLLGHIRGVARRLGRLKAPPALAIILDHGVIKDYGLSTATSSSSAFNSAETLNATPPPVFFSLLQDVKPTMNEKRRDVAGLKVLRFVDIRGEVRRKMGLGHGSIVVVRPDGYAAFVGNLEDGDRGLEVGLLPWLLQN